ncbi:HAD family hydrolase [Rhodococcoides fascians]|uniref:HAD family hydrolase n=1 Tax=Rhodococcoides fascians TaxID=1828 RepID=UPI00068C1E5C|nr:HAD family phosphatase [Rhodococcus fascians]
MSDNSIDTGPLVLVVDYGGVLTNPIADTIAAFTEYMSVQPADLMGALFTAHDDPDETIMAPLERGEITEATFLDRVGAALETLTGRAIDLSQFRPAWFSGRIPNSELLDYLHTLKSEGRTLGLLTNNVREWESEWRGIVPAGLFSVEVVSANEGVRKPEPEIYRRTTDRLGVPAARCLFVDDDLRNCQAARAHGMQVHHFTDTAGTIEAIDAWFGRPHQAPRPDADALLEESA